MPSSPPPIKKGATAKSRIDEEQLAVLARMQCQNLSTIYIRLRIWNGRSGVQLESKNGRQVVTSWAVSRHGRISS
jgi:hypothetical protein